MTPNRTDIARTQPAYLDRMVTGRPDEVAEIVAQARRAGRLVASSEPRQDPENRRHVYAYVRLLPAQGGDLVPVIDAKPRLSRRTKVVAAVVSGAVVGLALAGYAVYALIQALAPLVPYAAGIAALLGLWWLLGQVGACPGLHCPGCKH